MSALITSKLIPPRETKDHEEMRREMRALHAEINELRDEPCNKQVRGAEATFLTVELTGWQSAFLES